MPAPKLILVSPLQGWSTPLDEAPDAVFAGRMLGDGLAIDPTGDAVYAPCDGTLAVVAPSKHAVTVRADNGAEILLHVGIDTVGLGGEGFELHVRPGQRVHTGERLISFDLDLLARRARSVLTPVILTESPGFTISRRSTDCPVNVGDFLMEISAVAGTVAAGAANAGSATVAIDVADATSVGSVAAVGSVASGGSADGLVRRIVSVSLEHGIHARPAAMLAGSVKRFAAEVSIIAADRKANAKSPVAMMSLGVRKGDQIVVQASGVDAETAVAALVRALGAASDGASEASAGDDAEASASGARAAGERAAADHVDQADTATVEHIGRVDTAASATTPPSEKALKGVIASRGLAVGNVFQLARTGFDVTESGAGVAHESAELLRALAVVSKDLQHSVESAAGAANEIAAAHLGLIDDPELIRGARALMESGKSAGYAWRQVLRNGVDALRALSDPRMAERADDLLDLEARVLAVLIDATAAVPELPDGAVLIAGELLPSQLVAIEPGKLAGICLAGGGPTSHVAIIAAALDIPTLVAVGPLALDVPVGTPVVLDAEGGWLYVEPPRIQVELIQGQLTDRRNRRAAEQEAAQRQCRTADGVRIEVFANVGSVAEAEAAVRNGAEGCGLLRTEFLFLDRRSPPDEAEQVDQYQRIAQAMQGRILTIRTLDVGGDKPIPYLPLPHEDNPALGLRGIRTSLWKPDILRTQLRAILRVRPATQCRILLPMITDPAEIRAVRLMLDELRTTSSDEKAVLLGAMIETPAAALMADRLALEADFLSVGTNDLTQYTLAMDRGHPELAGRLDALHPAVLRLIAGTVEAARARGRTVAICGGLASEPAAVPLLIGLGVHELSMVPAVIAQMKALISTLDTDDCSKLALQALRQETAAAVRALILENADRGALGPHPLVAP